MTLVPCAQCGRPVEVKDGNARVLSKILICGTCGKKKSLGPSPYNFSIVESWESGGVRVTPISRKNILIRYDTRNARCPSCIHSHVCRYRQSVEDMRSICSIFKPRKAVD